ncbi:toll/interleukin-1 receptor domain-containing protein [Actinophytocola sp. KF-1]
MTHVFLSYAEEDSPVAQRLVSALVQAGATVFWWEAPENLGNRFILRIEENIRAADRFVAVMSPDYLKSTWCRRERELALLRDDDPDNQFISVMSVREAPYRASGFLGAYAWIPLGSAPADEQIAGAVRQVLANAGSTAGGGQQHGISLTFRNRADELHQVISALQTTGGKDLWVVTSPPRMGKSWFLDQIQRGLAEEERRVRLVDLAVHSTDLRTDPLALVVHLLDVAAPDAGTAADAGTARKIPDEVLRDIAAEISNRHQQQLFLLDSAELLAPDCAGVVRQALSEIYYQVKRAGNRKTRLSLIVGSRNIENWTGIGRGPGNRFWKVELSEFGPDIVEGAMRELNLDMGAAERWALAERIQLMSEGLPALLVKALKWGERTAFLKFDGPADEQERVFDGLARPYVEHDLLSSDSLLPLGSVNQAAEKAAIERALRAIVPYRLFTLSHLGYHIDQDPELRSALDDARWQRAELWEALGRTALVQQSSQELWNVISRPIRRLLYRLYYPTNEDRARANTTARQFHERWAERDAGKEQSAVLIECLWHEAARMMAVNGAAAPGQLPAVAAEIANEFVKSPMYEPIEVSNYIDRRLREDDELQRLLSGYDELFEQTRSSVCAALRGET